MRRHEFIAVLGAASDRIAKEVTDLVALKPDELAINLKTAKNLGHAHAGSRPRRRGDRMNTQEQWQLTLNAAKLYEHYPARYILGPWAPLLVDAARVAVGERVLDVACGTGVVARAAVKRVGATGRVVGVDLNPGMIAVARSLPATNDGPIEWLERSALDLRFKNASFDVVLCQQGLQFFPDKAMALQEMRRVLDHGGRLALSVWDTKSLGVYSGAVSAALDRFVGPEVAARFTASRKAPTADELQRLATEADFSAVEVSIRRINIHLPRVDKFVLDHLAATPVAEAIDAAGAETRKKIGASAMEQLQRYAPGAGQFEVSDLTG
jgi:ubiquinone/menaquinone biosynthesis C-methylase UbiE